MNSSSNESKGFRKSLKGPDAFQVMAAGGVSVLEKNKKAVIGGLVLLILVILVAFSANLYVGYETDSRRIAYAVHEDLFQSEVRKAADQRDKQLKVIEGLKKEISELKKAEGSADQSAIAQKEKDLEVKEKAVEAIQPDHSGSSAGFKAFFAANKSEPEGLMAGLRYVSTIIDDDAKRDESRKVLAELVKYSKNIRFYQIYARFMYVGLLEDLKDYKEALAQLDELIKVVPEAMKAKVLLARARIEVSGADKGAGRKTLDALIKDYKNAVEVDEARTFRALLN